MNQCSTCEKHLKENERLRGWLQGMLDHEPDEVCKDEFAYDRLLESFHDAARKALDFPKEQKSDKISSG